MSLQITLPCSFVITLKTMICHPFVFYLSVSSSQYHHLLPWMLLHVQLYSVLKPSPSPISGSSKASPAVSSSLSSLEVLSVVSTGSDGMVGGDREHHECQTSRTVWVLYNYTATQCGHQITSKGILAQHKRAMHEGAKFP